MEASAFGTPASMYTSKVHKCLCPSNNALDVLVSLVMKAAVVILHFRKEFHNLRTMIQGGLVVIPSGTVDNRLIR